MSDPAGADRPARTKPGLADLTAADLTVAGARPIDAAGWLLALRELAIAAAPAPTRRRRPRDDGSGLLVTPRDDGGPRGPRPSPAKAPFDLAA